METSDWQNWQWIATFSIICIHLIICLPSQMWCIFQFDAASPMHKKPLNRFPQITKWSSMVIIIGSLLMFPFTAVYELSPLIDTHTHGSLILFYLSHSSHNMFLLMFWGISGLVLARYWLMFYELNYCNSNINKQWKVYLNKNAVCNDFWLQHRSTWGSKSFIVKIACTISFSAYIVHSILFVLYYDPHDTKSRAMFELLETILGLLPALPVVIMYVKLPRFVNIFYLKYELQLFFYWCLGCIPICVGVDTLSVYFAGDRSITLVIQSVRQSLALLVINSIVFLKTYWMKRKIQHLKKSKTFRVDSVPLCKEDTLTLNAVLSHRSEEYFELFAQHLCREYSMETMLCFVELVQFKNTVADTFELNINQLHTQQETDAFYNYSACNLRETRNVPKSEILSKFAPLHDTRKNIQSLLEIAHELYCKYINDEDEDNQMVINISSDLRTFYDGKMNEYCDIDVTDINLFEFYDEVIEEMYELLQFSFERFIQTDNKINTARIVLADMKSYDVPKCLNSNYHLKH
eukprot:67498_1